MWGLSTAADRGASPSPSPGPANAVDPLIRRLLGFCIEQLEAIERRYAPGFALPRTFAGWAVCADATADLLYAISNLADAGVREVSGASPDLICKRVLPGVDGARTQVFAAYRLAEVLLRHGVFSENPLLELCDEHQRRQVARACSNGGRSAVDDGRLPRNYLPVIARCELARLRLGLEHDRGLLERMLEKVRGLLTDNPYKYLDDSTDRSGRYDIYALDVWVFSEPLRDSLGLAWQTGVRAALDLAESVAAVDGSALPWGRSTGVLAIALTIELAALALAEKPSSDAAARWLRRATHAMDSIKDWFSEGLVRAHQYRAQDAYRGPARRLQLTLDVLGKLAWAASMLRRNPDLPVVAAASFKEAYPDQDLLTRFDAATAAAVWSFRRGPVALSLPFVGPVRSHYLAAPSQPGCYELPVDTSLPCWTPLVLHRGERWTAGGLPTRVEHRPAAVSATWDRLSPLKGASSFRSASATPAADTCVGTRRTEFRVEGRSLVMSEALEFGETPDAVALCIPEIASRPLAIDVRDSTGHCLYAIDVSGIDEWRSAWSEFNRVHQIDLHPRREVRCTVAVTPRLRVSSTAHGHRYHGCLYDKLADRVVLVPPSDVLMGRDAFLRQIDVFHLHWPEWLGFDDLAEHQRQANRLHEAGIPVVWTAHNLTPHDSRPAPYELIYQCWASAAAAVIHHSSWGEQRMRHRYSFAPHCRHVVIPHGHFEDLHPRATARRAEAERVLGLPPTPLRIGLIGAPRRDKRVLEFLKGAAALSRTDIQVACWSLGPGESPPQARAIVAAEPYRWTSDDIYGLRLAACDAIALPFDPEGDMLVTGAVADAVGAGLAVMGSSWGYLVEVLGEALIPCGHTATMVRHALATLDVQDVAKARERTARLRGRYDWRALATRTADLLEQVVLARESESETAHG
jgi:glycosyltransferase involved in cell wall biosynthesis